MSAFLSDFPPLSLGGPARLQIYFYPGHQPTSLLNIFVTVLSWIFVSYFVPYILNTLSRLHNFVHTIIFVQNAWRGERGSLLHAWQDWFAVFSGTWGGVSICEAWSLATIGPPRIATQGKGGGEATPTFVSEQTTVDVDAPIFQFLNVQ